MQVPRWQMISTRLSDHQDWNLEWPMQTTDARVIKIFALMAMVGSLSGCKSLSWPSSTSGTGAGGWATSITETGKGLGNQVKSLGSTMSSAVGKATSAVKSTFSQQSAELDPETSLANIPKNLGPEIWVTNGQLLEGRGNYSGAMDNYTKALEKDPSNLPAMESVARLHMRQQQYIQAIDVYQRVVQVSPTAEHYAELANAQHLAGKLTEAQATIQKAISLDPNVARYHNNLAGVLVAMGRSDEAVTQLQKVYPASIANYNVAYLHYNNKNMAAAQQHLQTALQSDPNLAEARTLLAAMSTNKGVQATMAAFDGANQIYKSVQVGQSSSAAPGSTGMVTPTQSTNPISGMSVPRVPQ
jgi:Flp pilus assembly protein TadD